MTSLAAPLYAAPAALLYVLLGFSLASRKRACGEARPDQPPRTLPWHNDITWSHHEPFSDEGQSSLPTVNLQPCGTEPALLTSGQERQAPGWQSGLQAKTATKDTCRPVGRYAPGSHSGLHAVFGRGTTTVASTQGQQKVSHGAWERCWTALEVWQESNHRHKRTREAECRAPGSRSGRSPPGAAPGSACAAAPPHPLSAPACPPPPRLRERAQDHRHAQRICVL